MNGIPCTCGAPPTARLVDHAADCLVFRAVQAALAEKASEVIEREERRGGGVPRVRSWRKFWAIFFATVERRSSAPSPSIEANQGGTGRISKGADGGAHLAISIGAAILREIRESEREWARRDLGRAPTFQAVEARIPDFRERLRQHCFLMRSADFLAEETGEAPADVRRQLQAWGRITVRAMKRGALRIEGDRIVPVDLMEEPDVTDSADEAA